MFGKIDGAHSAITKRPDSAIPRNVTGAIRLATHGEVACETFMRMFPESDVMKSIDRKSALPRSPLRGHACPSACAEGDLRAGAAVGPPACLP
jgi:hypothetical protein